MMISMQSTSCCNFDMTRVGKLRTTIWITDWIVAFILAICPILQHYKGLFMDASSTLVVLLLPYIALRVFSKKLIWTAPLIPLALYAFYVSLIHGLQYSVYGREALLMVFFIAVLNGVVDTQRMLRISVKIAELACVCLIIQYLSYYLLGVHLQMIPTGMLLDTAEKWILLAQTGRISVRGSLMNIYRPSAFFLEPSHLAIYCTPLLAITLISGENNRNNMKSALIITLAILLSTSGMGIGSIALLWGLYGIFYFGINSKYKQIRLRDALRPHSIKFIMFFIIGFVVLYSTVGVFRSSVNRIFTGTNGGKSAIQGRTSTGIRALQMLSGWTRLTGMGNAISISDWTMSGFFYTAFRYGLVGSILSYAFYVKSLFICKRGYFWLAVMVMILSFFTVHTHAAFYRMYFVTILLGGYAIYSSEKKGIVRVR